MKMKHWARGAIGAGILMGCSAGAMAGGAAGESYMGVGYGFVTYDEVGAPEADLGALVGRFGHFFADNLAVEGRLGFGISDDTVNYAGTPVTVELDSVMGVYGMGHLPITENASIYGMVGFTRGELTGTSPTGSASEDDTDISFGFGADFRLNATTSINAEYAQYLDESGYDVTGIAIGASFKF